MKLLLHMVVVLFCSALLAAGAEYTADDFNRLVRENPVVVIGTVRPIVEDGELSGADVQVKQVLKNNLRNLTSRNLDVIVLKPTSNNLFWARAVIAYEEGQAGVWIINASSDKGRVQPADIITHFVLDKSSLPKPAAGQRYTPIEQWGAETQTGSWCVTKSPRTRIYSKKGAFLGYLEPGTTSDVIKTVKSSSGEAVVCRVGEGDRRKQEVVILARDVNLHPGLLDKVDEDRWALCVREAQLQSQIVSLTEELIARGVSGNPYSSRYRQVKTVYDQYWKKVKALQRKRDTARGAQRIRYADELRMMKGEDIRLGKAMETIKKQYDRWQKSHPQAKTTSPGLRALKKELAAVQEQLR